MVSLEVLTNESSLAPSGMDTEPSTLRPTLAELLERFIEYRSRTALAYTTARPLPLGAQFTLNWIWPC